MLKHIPLEHLPVTDYGWFVRRFHLSFAEYDNPERVQFGVLSALNDDTIQPGAGFETHPHQDAELISYCVEGQLAHIDSMGHQQILRRGDVQYLRTGSGMTHAEMNHSPDKSLRFLQIWIAPDEMGLPPHYRQHSFPEGARRNKLLQIASGERMDGVIQIHQDANVFVSEIEAGKAVPAVIEDGRQVYLVCVEGALAVNGMELKPCESIEISGEAQLTLQALEDAHLLMVEMAESMPYSTESKM